MKVESKFYNSHRLVKSEDLNHHGSLFAGRASEWFVESGFVAVAHVLPPKNVICLKIHGITFQKVVRLGDVLCFTSKIVHVGKSSILVYTRISKDTCGELVVDGFSTFINVDENTHPIPHSIELEDFDDSDIRERIEEILHERKK